MSNDFYSQVYSDDEAIEILKAVRDHSQEVEDIYDAASCFEPGPNLSRIYDYKDYLRNYLEYTEEVPASFTEWIDRYFNPLRYIRDAENSPSLVELSN